METLKQPPAGTMQIGVVYPQTELRGDPGAVRRIGKGAEDLGFDHLLAYDHVLGARWAPRKLGLALLQHGQDVARRVLEPGDVRSPGPVDALLVLS